ncbi:MAG: aldose 1-epimerase [Eudoraea sp.]|nr:aldose 1-epimerase [Eudoraea sp.]
MVILQNKGQKVSIEQGELLSYQVDGYELMHQIGSPGWGHTDTEMFPIIGPTDKAGFRVHVPRGNAIQDQHGLLRELSYTMEKKEDTTVSFVKEYAAGTVVLNSKFPDRSTAQRLIWPYSFKFKKTFSLTENSLKINFNVSGEKDMPFMIGYHPAFKLRTSKAQIKTSSASYSLEEIMKAGNRAVEVPQKEELFLEDERVIRIQTKGFGHFMLWSPVENMICVEPITFYPYAVDQAFLHEGFIYLGDSNAKFQIEIGLIP